MKICKICLNIAIFIAILCYPFALFFSDSADILAILVVLCVVFGVKFIIFSDKLALISAIFFLISIIFRVLNIGIVAYFYPILINLAFFAFFATSLNSEAIITKFAKMQNPLLDNESIIYTRNLTKIWCGIFMFNASVSGILACFDDKFYWSIFSGFLSYLLLGFMFGGEFLYRNLIFKKRLQNGFYK